jgi:hypothetical protein
MAKHVKRGPAPTVGIVQQKIFGLPVDTGIIFSNYKGLYKKRIEKRQRELIVKLSFLKPFLEGDEKILLITTGHSPPTVFEKMGLGWIFVYLKRSLLVFTTRRIFHVPTTPIYRYRTSIAHIRYDGCQSITMKGRSLMVAYSDMKVADTFFGLAGREKKKIRQILKTLPAPGEQKTSFGRVHLCPRCAAPLSVSRPICQHCQLKFKSKTMATLLSLFLPGGGYFYVRQPFLGIMAAVLEGQLLVGIGILLKDMLGGIGPDTFLLAGAAVLFILGKLLGIVHARVFTNEFIPCRKNISFQALDMQAA